MTVQITEFAKKHLPAIVSLLNDEYRDHDEFVHSTKREFSPKSVVAVSGFL